MFNSTEDIFKSAREIIASLEKDGSSAAARELREGFGALNGLTDGWAAFLESIDRVLRDFEADMKPEQQEALKLIREAAYYAVYRRKPGPWWKFW